MTRAICLLLTLASIAWSQSSARRIAVVRVSEIYHGLESTKELDERVRREKEEILKDARAVELRRIIAEMRDLESMLRDKTQPLDEQGETRLVRSLEIKRQEAQTLHREFEGFREQREKDIHRAMIAEMRRSLDHIAETARRIAGEHGYELLIDSSGETNTGAPFILYQKNPADLTEAVTAAIVGKTESTPTD